VRDLIALQINGELVRRQKCLRSIALLEELSVPAAPFDGGRTGIFPMEIM
jgi:hypothetical protein